MIHDDTGNSLSFVIYQLSCMHFVDSIKPWPITTKVVSSNPVFDEVYSIQHYVIKFVSVLRQVGGFLRVLWFFSTNETDRHDTTDILLKVALNTITPSTPSNLEIKKSTNICHNICAYWLQQGDQRICTSTKIKFFLLKTRILESMNLSDFTEYFIKSI